MHAYGAQTSAASSILKQHQVVQTFAGPAFDIVSGLEGKKTKTRTEEEKRNLKRARPQKHLLEDLRALFCPYRQSEPTAGKRTGLQLTEKQAYRWQKSKPTAGIKSGSTAGTRAGPLLAKRNETKRNKTTETNALVILALV